MRRGLSDKAAGFDCVINGWLEHRVHRREALTELTVVSRDGHGRNGLRLLGGDDFVLAKYPDVGELDKYSGTWF